MSTTPDPSRRDRPAAARAHRGRRPGRLPAAAGALRIGRRGAGCAAAASPVPAGASAPPFPPRGRCRARTARLERPARSALRSASPPIRRCWRCWTTRPPSSPCLATPQRWPTAPSRWWAGAMPPPTASASRRTWPPNWRTRLVVVSGLARGIDAAAHTGALRTGRTIAAVAGGLDVPYPPEHADLQRRIAEAGAVVTEAPLGTAPQARHFPRRNRIIAGLALGVIVVEAALRSGSLITARLAQDAGRELFAVPGSPLDPRSRGANDLIRQGAHLTETAAGRAGQSARPPRARGARPSPAVRARPTPGPRRTGSGLAGAIAETAGTCARARRQVIDLLGTSPTAVDDVVRRCQFSARRGHGGAARTGACRSDRNAAGKPGGTAA